MSGCLVSSYALVYSHTTQHSATPCFTVIYEVDSGRNNSREIDWAVVDTDKLLNPAFLPLCSQETFCKLPH